jgi:hypothetical protein
MCEAAAQNAPESVTDLLLRCFWVRVKNALGCQDYPADAKATLGRAFLKERLLNWVRMFRCAKAFQRCNFAFADRTHRHNAGPHDLPAHDHGAGSALSHSATESRSAQSKLVVENE